MAYHRNPADRTGTICNSSQVVEPIPVFAIRVFGMYDPFNIFLQRAQEFLEGTIIGFLACGCLKEQCTEVVVFLLNQEHLRNKLNKKRYTS